MSKWVSRRCGREDCLKLFYYRWNPKGGRPRTYCSKRCYRFSLTEAQRRYVERKKKKEITKYGIW